MRRLFEIAILAAIAALAIGGTAGAKVKSLSIFKVSEPPAELGPGDSFPVEGKVINYGAPPQRGLVNAHLLEKSGPDKQEIPLDGSDTVGPVEKGEQVPFSFEATLDEYGALEAGQTYKVRVCVQKPSGEGKRSCRKAGKTTFVSPADFAPGARTLGDELFPQIGNGGYDASNYAIALNYDPDENEFLEGTSTTMTATAIQDLSELSLDFQDIPVSAVSVNGTPADGFEQVDAEPGGFGGGDPVTQPMKLVVDPPGEGILDGSEFTVRVEYSGTPVMITDADQSVEGWIPACYPLEPPQTCDGAFVVNQPIGAQGWFPSNNFPTDRATFDTSITVPDSHKAVGIGELAQDPAPSEGFTTWEWTEDDPTSTYLTTATVGLFDLNERTITDATTGEVIPQYDFIDSSATQAQRDQINTTLGRVEEMTSFLSKRFGPYPYDSGGVVADRAAGVGYALEVATKPHYAGGFSSGNPGVSQSTHVHEIAHQWMGNAVTLESWNDIWWQEGWANWTSWIWNFTDGTDPRSPGERWSEAYEGASEEDWATIPTELNGDPANLFSFFPTYERGAMTYQGYREIVGQKKFYEFARELQTRFAYGNVSSEDVVDLMIEVSEFEGDDLALLEDYFDQWLYQGERPTITSDDFT